MPQIVSLVGRPEQCAAISCLYNHEFGDPQRVSVDARFRGIATGGNRNHRRQRAVFHARTEQVKEVRLKTPFGAPSDAYVCGTLEGRKVAFLARHGRGHRILPSELNFRANIHGFKQLGVERIVSISAVGSLKEEHKPLDFVIPDQFFDRTRHRVDTFFGGGVVAHIAFADPVCGELAAVVESACKKVGVVGKRGGTYLCMEGPQFSTKAESNVYRSWAWT